MSNFNQEQITCPEEMDKEQPVNYGHEFSIQSLSQKVYEIPGSFLQSADVVLAKDNETNNLTVFYGLDHVNKVLNGTTDKSSALVVTIRVDQESGDLNKLFKIVEKLKGKGSCDYKIYSAD